MGTSIIQSVRLGADTDELADERAKFAALIKHVERPPLDVAAAQALAGPASCRLTLGSQVSGSNARIVLMPDGTGYLAEHTLRPLPAGRPDPIPEWCLSGSAQKDSPGSP